MHFYFCHIVSILTVTPVLLGILEHGCFHTIRLPVDGYCSYEAMHKYIVIPSVLRFALSILVFLVVGMFLHLDTFSNHFVKMIQNGEMNSVRRLLFTTLLHLFRINTLLDAFRTDIVGERHTEIVIALRNRHTLSLAFPLPNDLSILRYSVFNSCISGLAPTTGISMPRHVHHLHLGAV